MSDTSAGSTRGNLDCDWDLFDCDAYVSKNYSKVSAPDRVILEQLIDIHSDLPPGGEMIEIGAGPNLYPLIAASIHRDRILVTDVSNATLRYLQQHIAAPQVSVPWNLWLTLAQKLDPEYHDLGSSLNLLHDRCTFKRVSVYNLPKAAYDFSSMHFVAESITNEYREFLLACEKALQCVRNGGSFVASFMLSSQGYSTGDIDYPATAVGADEILSVLSRHCTELSHIVLEGSENIVRQGHTGILLAYGAR